ncbi:MAG: DUF2157 domain-containing protein [Verrucomicrobiaceae bacterium]|nr:DUF2157 domain-containing protein [Verrucomicrobiaceae bacterium]
MSQSHHRWLIDRLPEWEKCGIVPADVAERLRTLAEEGERAEASGRGESRVAQIVLGGLGALLVGAGVLALIAHNWDQVPRSLRIAGSFVLMASAQGLVAWILRRGDAVQRWVREAGALFLVLAAGGCLALVAQIYNLGGDWPDFLFAWTLLVVPVMWATRAHACALFHLVCITIWSLSHIDTWRHHHPWQESPCLYPLLLAAALVYWPGIGKPRPALPNAVRWTAAASAMIGFDSLATWIVERTGGGEAGWLWMLTAAVIAMVPLCKIGIDERLSRKPQVVLGALVLFFAAFFCSTAWGARELVSSLETSVYLPWCWVLMGLFVVFAVSALIQRRWAVAAVGSLALTPLLSLASMHLHARPDLAWAFTIQLFAIGLVMILAEFFGAKGSPRFGALLIAVLIVVRMGDSELSFITKSVVFIVTGLAFIGFNLVWSRKIGAKRKEAAP